MGKSILDKDFRYTNAASTDIRKTFERIRKEQKRAETVKVAEHLAKAAPTVAAAADAVANLGEVMRLGNSGDVLPLRRKGAK